MRQNLQSSEAQVSDLQALCTAETAKAQRLHEELSEAKALSKDALNVLGELESKVVATCEAISSTFEGIGASATPPTLDIVRLAGLIGWISETGGSLLPTAQLYGDFCAMVSARSLLQSIEMTGCDHHIALQKHTFRYPTDMSTLAVSRASKATTRLFTTNYWCKHGCDLALWEAKINR